MSLQKEKMKKTAYIIGISQPVYGLFALYKHIASHIIYARKMGYVPIVDCKHYSNMYFKDNQIYKENVYEYFFEQPDGYSLDDLDSFDNVIIGKNTNWADSKYDIDLSLLCKNPIMMPYAKEYSECLKLNNSLQEYISKKYVEKVKEDVVLGVLCRGTDYTNMKPMGHYIQPTPVEMIEKVKQVLEKNNEISKIYLATEDFDVYSEFKKVFGEKLIESEQYLFSSTKESSISEIKVNRKNHFYNLAVEYLTSLYILSKCPYFVGGVNNGTFGVYLLSSLFKNQKWVYIWNIGMYGKVTYCNFIEKIFSIKQDEFIEESPNKEYSQKRKSFCVTILGIKFSYKKRMSGKN